VQLERAERKLGLDKDKRYEMLKALRKEYYKKHRPRCPFCKASKAISRGSTETEDKWSCGRCKKHYKTPKKESEAEGSQRVTISFKLGQEGLVSHLMVKIDGSYKTINGKLEAIVGDEDWKLRLGGTGSEDVASEN
jgi:ribosomal protein L37AE/L43A